MSVGEGPPPEVGALAGDASEDGLSVPGAVEAAAPLPVVYRDPWLVVVLKPPRMAVHRSPLTPTGPFVLQSLRRQLRQSVYPAHRLDRATRGLLVLALDPETQRRLQQAFAERAVHKTYEALVRGWPPEALVLDAELPGHRGALGPAVTRVRRLARTLLPWPVGRWPTARYAWVQAEPETGRHHQIRRHLAHANFPVVGDRTHGDNRHNRLLAEKLGRDHLWLRAVGLRFAHPHTGAPLTFSAPPDAEVEAVRAALGLLDDAVETSAQTPRGDQASQGDQAPPGAQAQR